MGLLGFFISYLLGGLTFIPLLICAVFLHAHLSFPRHDESSNDDLITKSGDDLDVVEKARKDLGDKFTSRSGDGSDVAAGYFAVCREYVPGGVNGKPPERTTPAGSTVVQPKSDSVYQSIYRGIFDRKQTNGPLDNKTPGKPPRRGGNVFYVVLRYVIYMIMSRGIMSRNANVCRHGYIMLFDDKLVFYDSLLKP